MISGVHTVFVALSHNILIPNDQWRSHWGGKGGRVPPLTAKKKKKKKMPKIRKKEEKLGRKVKNREVSFTLTLLTDRAGYATANDGEPHLLNYM